MTLILTGPGQTAVHRPTEFTLDGVRHSDGEVRHAYPQMGEEEPILTVTGPAGLTTAVPAFPDGAGWRVRFAPPLPGHWQVVASHGVELSPPLGLDVDPDPAARGAIHPQDRAFRYESGEPFLPLGADLGPLADAPRRLAELAAAGATVTRLAAEPPGKPARLLDEVLDLAVERGIAVIMTLPATDWTLHAGARWAAHPALFAWSSMSLEWTEALRAVDPYGHPIVGADFEIGPGLGDLPVVYEGDRSPWATIFSGFAGHLGDLRFNGLSRFLAGECLGSFTPVAAGPALALTSPNRALLWLPSTSEGSVALGGFTPGAYTATWCAAADGSALRQNTVVTTDGTIRLALPPLSADTAVRLTRTVPAQRQSSPK
ncbi:MAG: hypothetical protein HOU81_19985 [Hamadaea sp.]|uniref:hypothetical protein n=1 Tax=Hamadaea sp. TaxID=2024425 RepID=UPI0017FDDF65|nr:hypothetical protein [Hamadaea sp.]NUR73103.1 hypothetical protein [Hamadaea sp.]NUT23015.1 hypothetical protein [Hamadaea sp.]